jgi:hypothetical protein
MPRGDRTSGEAFSGTLYRTTGPHFSDAAFDSSQVKAQAVGTLSLRFSDANNGTMEAVVNGTRVVKPVTRQVFGPVPTCDTAGNPGIQNFTDLFWNSPAGSESGWGLFLTHQGDNVFTVWYTYVSGHPTWFVASNAAKVASQSGGRQNTFSGTLYRTSGAPFSASPWPASSVKAVAIGAVLLQFYDDTARFSWTVGYLNGQKSIEREAFSTLRSFCH